MDALMMVFGIFRLSGYATEPLLDSHEIHALLGEPSRITVAAPTHPLTVVSWNIAQGAKFDRVRDVLLELDADVYLLQEVDNGVRRTDYRNVAKNLADSLDMNWVFAGEFQEIGQARRNTPAVTGQAILSRYPIVNAMALPFKKQARLRWNLDPFQPRRGGRMAIRAESGGVIFYNAHIESAKDDDFRLKQVEEMLDDHLESPRQSRPVVVAGDLNTGRPPDRSPVVRGFTLRGFVDALGGFFAPRRTSIHHANPLDWIFVRNAESRTGRVVPVAKASDHYPLEALIAPSTAVAAN